MSDSLKAKLLAQIELALSAAWREGLNEIDSDGRNAGSAKSVEETELLKMVDVLFDDQPVTEGEPIVDHKDAAELAQMRYNKSNLARCYLDIAREGRKAIMDHEFRELIDGLTETARIYAGTESLRERLAGVLIPYRALTTDQQRMSHSNNYTEFFGLTGQEVEKLAKGMLKPEEMTCDDRAKQHRRVSELLRWFVRFQDGNSNPKWAVAHAMELAYYIVTDAPNQYIDVERVRKEGFYAGLAVDLNNRAMLEKFDIVPKNKMVEWALNWAWFRENGLEHKLGEFVRTFPMLSDQHTPLSEQDVMGVVRKWIDTKMPSMEEGGGPYGNEVLLSTIRTVADKIGGLPKSEHATRMSKQAHLLAFAMDSLLSTGNFMWPQPDRPLQQAGVLAANAPTHKHIKRGSTYYHIGTGIIQVDGKLRDMDAVEVYVGEDDQLWMHELNEFNDPERFQKVGVERPDCHVWHGSGPEPQEWTAPDGTHIVKGFFN